MTRTGIAALWLGLSLALFAGQPSTTQAQLRRVLDLNRQGMDAYNNLEIEQSMELLQQALEAANRGGVSGSPLARTYVNLGVVAIGGFSDNGQGLSYFVQALQADSSVQLDPLTSTPDIQSVFQLAQRRAGGGNNNNGNNTNNGGNNTNNGGNLPPGTIPHTPAREQLTQTALPIFIAAPDDAPVGAVYVYYKAPGMRDFRRLEMRRMTGGFGLELPCQEVMAPRIQYYIVAFDSDENPIGFSGSEQEPVAVPIVSSRNEPPPALPGAPPPEQCTETECPPGMPGCNSGGGSAGLGDTCRDTSECRGGLTCEDNFCVAGEGGGGGGGGGGGVDDNDMPRVFIRAGFAFGLGYASSGSPADSSPVDLNDDGVLTPEEEAHPDNASYILSDTNPDCDADPGSYCVRLEQSGFLIAPALHFSVGGWIIPRFGVAGTFRFQFNSGQGSLAAIMLGLRAMVNLTDPAPDGLHADVHLGTSYGQIQLQPPQNGANEPYIISGFNGVQLGGTVGYRVVRAFDIFVTPEIHLLFPTFLFAIDITAGVGVNF